MADRTILQINAERQPHTFHPQASIMRVNLIVVPYDSGWRGKRMGAGPDQLLAAGLADELRRAGAEVEVQLIEMPAGGWTAEVHSAFYLSRCVASFTRAAVAEGAFPLILSGNCGPAAIGAVAALDVQPRVYWFDAHGDFNTPETTVSGFLDGMALATLTGHCWTGITNTIPGFVAVPESSVVLLGARDLDQLEVARLARSEISCVAAAEVRSRLTQILPTNRSSSVPAYLHIDLDILDPTEVRANGYAAAGGLTMAELEWAVRAIAETTPIAAAAVTAYDPTADENSAMPAHASRLLVSLLECVAQQCSA